MKETFVVADTHFGHKGVCQFTNKDGSKIRPWTCPEEMDEDMVKFWNETVRPEDKVYHLGDVVINRKALATLGRLNGDKVLIKGNHDLFKLHEYSKYFRDIRGSFILNKYIMTHIPIHIDSLYRWDGNVHGHLHTGRVLQSDGRIDPKYFCVSVEHINFRPIHRDELIKRFEEQRTMVSVV